MTAAALPPFVHDPDRRAACTLTDNPEIFFPEPHQPTQPALEVCARCPLRVPCADWAMRPEHAGLPGVWGGMTEGQRAWLRYAAGAPAGRCQTRVSRRKTRCRLPAGHPGAHRTTGLAVQAAGSLR